MGFLGGILGTTNDYRATAPTNNFQATPANLDYSSYANAIQNSMGGVNPNAGAGTAAQQSALAAALQARMNGSGPSVAENQLREASNQNVLNTASAIGSQRGINPALAGRLIAQQSAGAGQQVAGQAATLRAQEQIANSGLLAQALAQQRGQDIGQQQANTSLFGTAGMLQQGQNALTLQNQMEAQRLNQSTAAQNAGLNLGAQQINAGVTQQNAGNNTGLVGGVLNGAGSVATALAMAEGGEVMPVLHAADGVMVPSPFQQMDTPVYGETINNLAPTPAMPLTDTPALPGAADGGSDPRKQAVPFHGMSTNPADYMNAFYGATSHPALGALLAVGGPVPGKAQMSGDANANDTVPAMLSPGEIVLPRSVAQAPDADEKAADFVAAIKKHLSGAGAAKGYGALMASHQKHEERIKKLEAMSGRKR